MPVQLNPVTGHVSYDVEQNFERLRLACDALEARLASIEQAPAPLLVAADGGSAPPSALTSIFQLPGIVAGPNGAVQFNDTGILGGDSGFTYDKLGQSATVGNQFTSANQLLTGNQVVVGPGGIYTDGSVHALGGLSSLLGLFTPGVVDAAEIDAFTVLAKVFVQAPIVTASVSFRERGRSTPLGEWIDIPFNAADFVATAGTWTVGSALLHAYTLIGQTCLYAFNVQGTSLTGAGSELQITLPVSAANKEFTGVTFIGGDNGPALGFCATRDAGSGGTNKIGLFRGSVAAWVNSVNNTGVRGVIAFALD